MTDKGEKHNTSYKIKVEAPLLRPGMEIEAGPVSEHYVVPTVRKLLDKVRQINE